MPSLTKPTCAACGAVANVQWIQTTRLNDPAPTYMPGRITCPRTHPCTAVDPHDARKLRTA